MHYFCPPHARSLYYKRVSDTHRARDPFNLTHISTSPSHKYLTVCFYKAQSVGRSEIELFVCDESIDVLMLTETWLRCLGDEAKCVDLAPTAYTMPSFLCSTRQRGGEVGGNGVFPSVWHNCRQRSCDHSVPFPNVSFELPSLLSVLRRTLIYFVCIVPPFLVT